MNATDTARPDSTSSVTPAAKPKRRLWVSVLLWFVILGSGFVIGAGATLIAIRNGVLHRIHHPDEIPPRVAARLQRDLDLSDEQTQQVAEILRRRQMALQSIRRQWQPQVEQQLDLLQEEVGEVLGEEQQEKWETRFNQFRRTWIPRVPPARGSR